MSQIFHNLQSMPELVMVWIKNLDPITQLTLSRCSKTTHGYKYEKLERTLKSLRELNLSQDWIQLYLKDFGDSDEDD
jgi:hypothetical protein